MRIPLPGLLAWARPSLLVAALCSVAGTALGPATHVSGGEAGPVATTGAAAGSAGTSDGDPRQGPRHEELSCCLCQALTTGGMPSATATLPLSPTAAHCPVESPGRGFSHASPTSARARAPPHA